MQILSPRPADLGDAAAIADIHVRSWRDAYASVLDPEYLAGPIEADRLTLWSDRLKQPPENQVVQVAETPDRQVVGFICSHQDKDERWGTWIDNLHVLPTMRGHKIGERLFCGAAIISEARSSIGGIYLWVFEANTSAIRFYERLGGNIVGRDHSKIPAARGAVILRMHWPSGKDMLSR